MARSVKQTELWCGTFRKVMSVDRVSWPSVHVFHANGNSHGASQSDDVNVVAFFTHGLHFLKVTKCTCDSFMKQIKILPIHQSLILKRCRIYCQTSNISHTIVGNKIVDHSRCSWSITGRRCSNYIFIIDFNIWLQWIGQTQLQDEMGNI